MADWRGKRSPGIRQSRWSLTDEPEVLEGSDVEGLVVLEFRTVEAARAWYDSPAYAAARGHRFNGAEYRGFISKDYEPARVGTAHPLAAHSPIDDEFGAGRLFHLGGEQQHHLRDLIGLAEAACREALEHLVDDLVIGCRRPRPSWFGTARVNRIHADVVWAIFHRRNLAHPAYREFRSCALPHPVRRGPPRPRRSAAHRRPFQPPERVFYEPDLFQYKISNSNV
jgi:hypothetical protein